MTFAVPFTKAEVLLRSDKNSSDEIQPETVEGELKATESVLDNGTIKSIRSDLDSVLQEALTMKLWGRWSTDAGKPALGGVGLRQ